MSEELATIVKKNAEEIINAGRWIASRHWCPATGGNFSQRLPDQTILMTASGCDKGQLSVEDLLRVTTAGQVINTGEIINTGLVNTGFSHLKPSAEMLLHLALYQLDSQTLTVLHTHSIAATVLSRLTADDNLCLQGYEMQKSLCDVHDHNVVVRLTIFDNDQDIDQLAQRLRACWLLTPLKWGFLVRGHGLYVWGRNMAEARRHLEGIEFLLACELEMRRLQ